MYPIRFIVSPSKYTHQGDGSGGLSVTKQMRNILEQPGYLSIKMGGQTLRQLYNGRSTSFNPQKLTYFGLCCYLGDYDRVVKNLEMHLTSRVQRRHTNLGISPSSSLARNVYKDLNHMAKLDLCRVLLESGSEPNQRNRYGEVPLLGCFQTNGIGAIDLMEFGADIDIADADGVRPREFQLKSGPEVTATVQRWLRKRSGDEKPMDTKACEFCKKPGGNGVQLRLCSKCQTARYCSTTCQRSHWPTHKPLCQPFTARNTVTLIPYYPEDKNGFRQPMAKFSRDLWSIPTSETPPSHRRFAHTPKNLSADSPKSIVIKVQVPFDAFSSRPNIRPDGDLLVYTKKRDFVCTIRRGDAPEEYDRISQVVRTRGVGGAKAYFAAELRGKTALIVKISEVLAEQPF
ncbi:uncharacterized protein EV420DRAFT_1483997 [Desarmillaria tabescens]|uniref:MYND-type domain-containing protein n=1 Tax=Armillaria tabescens TaxID=1929756 RepID=A0AA39JQC5_ARMTA|nr:uncharacterized protein EV420DRAFT_1483997 [Desarmillaria tabescens]KAK0446562.1 hypothetical protein EV420DRAFT_1483997 [Desarmillaria tabescens]